MDIYDVSHYSRAEVLRWLYSYGSKSNEVTALYLAFIGEADARKLYADEGFSSMHGLCVRRLYLSDSAAFKRIHAARAARRFPELFVAVADGRLHLSAVCMLAPHLTAENVASLMAEATHRRKFEIEQILAGRFPAPDRLAVDPEIRRLPTEPGRLALLPQSAVAPVVAPAVAPAVAPGRVDAPEGAELPPGEAQAILAPAVKPTTLTQEPLLASAQHAVKVGLQRPGSAAPERSPTDPTPLAADRYEIRFTIDAGTYEKLRFAQNLLGHAVPSGSLVDLFCRGLSALVAETLKKRFAVGTRATVSRGRQTQPSRRPGANRYVSSPVRRAVWERDGGQCTFVSAEGQRCDDRRFLEFDHVIPVARGGKPTVEGMRLRCRTHNQLEAERAFGRRFMKEKREQKRKLAPREIRDGKPEQPSSANAESVERLKREWGRDLTARLAALGVRRVDALKVIKRSEALGQATFEACLKVALEFMCPRGLRILGAP